MKPGQTCWLSDGREVEYAGEIEGKNSSGSSYLQTIAKTAIWNGQTED